MKRKFVTEYSIGYLNSYTAMLTANQLLSDDKMTPAQIKAISECHIYTIAARPAPYFKNGSIKHEGNKLSGCLCYKIDGVERSVEFSDFPWELDEDVISISCDYPFKKIISYDSKGHECTYIPADYLANMYITHGVGEVTELNNYEVLYVGQALGNQGDRNAMDRLRSHSTLQKILARTAYDYPDKEIMIFMHEFKHENLFSSIDGRAVGADRSDKNEKRLLNAIRNPPNKKQKIGLIEAGLIRYFQPCYNEIYKIKFPSTKHKVLQSCYDLDISGFVVELNSDNLNYFLYSKLIPSSNHHIARIDLFTAIDRSSFFSPTGFKVSPGVIS
ncbi:MULTISPECIES: hypothetical protein [Serratia]|uniref:hypothetical protein n=1 Tax=Serratia TaxID=613 RepID=UPI000B6208D4|nr:MULTISPECIES: hypothetical protein [Serratia]ASM22328.1 hypothetical protein BVG92_12940 [Serratia marcescens]ASM27100.1 hypothetical protein BVG89_12940 [Serratia marcescens]MBN5418739.1 hypothetical protein [Serratia marcescens]